MPPIRTMSIPFRDFPVEEGGKYEPARYLISDASNHRLESLFILQYIPCKLVGNCSNRFGTSGAYLVMATVKPQTHDRATTQIISVPLQEGLIPSYLSTLNDFINAQTIPAA
jgi:hypothetical protein